MRWATRARLHVDRTARAWLIARFIDPDARVVFLDDPDDLPPDATGFDMRGVALSHHSGDCSLRPSCATMTSTTPCSGRSRESCTKPTSMTSATTPPKPRGWTS